MLPIRCKKSWATLWYVVHEFTSKAVTVRGSISFLPLQLLSTVEFEQYNVQQHSFKLLKIMQCQSLYIIYVLNINRSCLEILPFYKVAFFYRLREIFAKQRKTRDGYGPCPQSNQSNCLARIISFQSRLLVYVSMLQRNWNR